MNRALQELAQEIRLNADGNRPHAHNKILLLSWAKRLEAETVRVDPPQELWGVFDQHGKLFVAYPRKIQAEAYACAFRGDATVRILIPVVPGPDITSDEKDQR